MAGLVGEPRTAGDVADGVEARDVGAAVLVGDDMTAIQVHAQRFQALVVRRDANGDDALLGGQLLDLAASFDGDGHTVLGLLDLADLGADAELYAALLERLLGGLGDLFVLDRHDAVDGFDDGHLGAQRAVEAGELDADGARANHDQ